MTWLPLRRVRVARVHGRALATSAAAPSWQPSWSQQTSWPSLLLRSVGWTAAIVTLLGVSNLLTRGNVRGYVRDDVEPVVPARMIARKAAPSPPSAYGFVGDDDGDGGGGRGRDVTQRP